MMASMMPVNICRIKTVNAALPKMYHQLADLRGTSWAAVSRMTGPSCNLSPNQRPMLLSLDILFSLYLGSRLSIEWEFVQL